MAYIYLLETPNQLADLRGRAATAEVQSAGLRAENSTMQTQVAGLARLTDSNRETLGELQQQKEALDSLRAELETAARQNATVVAEARSSRDAIALFATVEADRAELISDLKQRSDRIERFLTRLSDISEDAALDLGDGGSAVPPTATEPAVETPTATTITEPAAHAKLNPDRHAGAHRIHHYIPILIPRSDRDTNTAPHHDAACDADAIKRS